jgi:hypothetical protein
MSGAGLIGEAGSEVGNERPCCCKLRSLVISWGSLFLRQHNQPEIAARFQAEVNSVWRGTSLGGGLGRRLRDGVNSCSVARITPFGWVMS